MLSEAHPGERAAGQLETRTAVLLCADPNVGADAALEEAIEAALRGRSPQVQVAVVADVCEGSRATRELLGSLGARRVVVVCRRGRTRRDEIVAHLRRAGIRPGGATVVDLATCADVDATRAAAEVAARVDAALALVSSGDLSEGGREKVTLDTVRLSRRGLFSLAALARRPVVRWVEGRCEEPAGCRACVAACPQQALSLSPSPPGAHLLVDADRCNGCGACLGACRTGALELGGRSMEGFERAARALADGARRLSPPGGVAITCSGSVGVPLGEGWLPLEVPSFEMVTAGWPLQFLAAGLPVQLVACEDDPCRARARALASLCAELLEVALVGDRRGSAASSVANGIVSPAVIAPTELVRARPSSVTLGEPEATTRALATFGVLEPSSRPWRVESPASPLGDLHVDSGDCSACGLCARRCPGGALTVELEEPEFVLSFDASSCTACGACAASCPEAAVSLTRAVDSCALASRRTLVVKPGTRRCRSCGRPIGGGPFADAIAARLTESYAALADRLTFGERCADCLLHA